MLGNAISAIFSPHFAATIGTIQVKEEIDDLRTTGVSPIDFLVMPRMNALSILKGNSVSPS